jgi:hypothetical protein
MVRQPYGPRSTIIFRGQPYVWRSIVSSRSSSITAHATPSFSSRIELLNDGNAYISPRTVSASASQVSSYAALRCLLANVSGLKGWHSAVLWRALLCVVQWQSERLRKICWFRNLRQCLFKNFKYTTKKKPMPYSDPIVRTFYDTM